MRGAFDFSSWQGVVSTLLGLVVVSLVAVGIRLLVMQRVQRRRERENRQINERLKTLIAAYTRQGPLSSVAAARGGGSDRGTRTGGGGAGRGAGGGAGGGAGAGLGVGMGIGGLHHADVDGDDRQGRP